MTKLSYVGLDVHARSIAIAFCEGGKAVEYLGTIAHDVPSLKKKLASLGSPSQVQIFYEAGPTGYGLCRTLRASGYACEVIAPSLIPSAPGDRVKTDRRDAEKLARLGRGGLLTPVSLPSLEQEALRDLVRARGAAKVCERRAGQQLDKFLLRHSLRPQEKFTKWGVKYIEWARSLKFSLLPQKLAFEEYLSEYEHQRARVKRFEEHLKEAASTLVGESKAMVESLVALKGVQFLTAVTLVSEIGDMTRFGHPTQLMAYAGLVPREHSSGESVRKGGITKTGNTHLRRIIGESAWSYARGRVSAGKGVRKRREGMSPGIVAIAERADHRLRTRYRRLSEKGKHKNKVVIAVARELLGFVWAVGVQAQLEERERQPKMSVA